MQPLCFASQYSVCMIDAAWKLKSCLHHGKIFFPPVQIVPWYMRALPRNCPSHGGTYAPHMGCLGILQLHSSCRVGFLGKHCKGVSILWVGLQVCHLSCQTVYCGHACMASCYQSFTGIQISERQNPQQKMHIDLVAWHVGLTTSRQLCEDVLSDAKPTI